MSIYTVVGASVNSACPSFASDRPVSPSLFQAGPVRHRYFNRASVIAKLQFRRVSSTAKRESVSDGPSVGTDGLPTSAYIYIYIYTYIYIAEYIL